MERNRGIDLLRMLAMLFVAALHIIGIGGVITGSELLSANFLTAQFLRIAMLCAVNCYALISGFVGWNRKPKLSSLTALWGKSVCCCTAATALTAWLIPGSVDWKTALNAVLPVTTGQYWYLTAYVGLFVFLPILNYAVRQMPRRELEMALAGILVLFSLLPISPLTDAFYLHDGYSVLWLCVMYLLGAYLGKYELLKRVSPGKWALVYLLSILFAWLPRMAVLAWKPVYWQMGYGNILIEYTSPTIVLAAVSLLGIFSAMKPPALAEKAAAKLSPHAFGAYLFHAHPLVFRYWLTDRFAYLGMEPVWILVLTVFGAALGICALGTAADWLLSKLLPLHKWTRKLDTLIK